MGPEVGFRLVIAGGGVTVKVAPLLATPSSVTITFPVVAPAGTVVATLVAVQVVTVATLPLNVTVLVPCEDPKFAPVIVTAPPTGPEAGFKLVIVGGGVTLKFTPLLAAPPTVTTTFPVVAPAGAVVEMLVALQLVAVATIPLNVTALVPCEDPKFVPVIVTAPPMGPELGFRLVIAGGGVTVKFTPLLATPPTVTTTFPVFAPTGTVVAMLVGLQLVTLAAVPAKVTMLAPWLAPNPVPAIVTTVPTVPELGVRTEMSNSVR